MDRLPRVAGFVLCSLLWGAGTVLGTEPAQEVTAVLRHWSQISQDRGREAMLARSLQEYIGPLREEALLQRFDWKFASSNELVAAPVDASDQLFMPQLKITIDAEGMPTQITIGQRTQDVRALVRSELVRMEMRENLTGTDQIVPVSFEDAPQASQQPVNARLNQILCCWGAASGHATAVRTSFRRTDYDLATEVESHSSGEFIFAAPRQGYYRTVPTIRPATDSARIGVQGKPFVQLPGAAMQHYWTDRELLQIESASKAYFTYTLPQTGRDGLGIGSFDNLWRRLMSPQSALPFVVGLNEKELRANYEWQLVSDSKTSVILEGRPKSGPDLAHFFKVQVILDPKTWRTMATSITDISRTQETIHQFYDQCVCQNAKDLGDWKPNLTGLVQANSPAGVATVPAVEPASAEIEVEGR